MNSLSLSPPTWYCRLDSFLHGGGGRDGKKKKTGGKNLKDRVDETKCPIGFRKGDPESVSISDQSRFSPPPVYFW